MKVIKRDHQPFKLTLSSFRPSAARHLEKETFGHKVSPGSSGMNDTRKRRASHFKAGEPARCHRRCKHSRSLQRVAPFEPANHASSVKANARQTCNSAPLKIVGSETIYL